MKYRFLILVSLLLMVSTIYSKEQVVNDEDSTRYLSTYGKIDLGFSGLGLSIETPLSDRVLFEIAAGVGAGYRVNEDFRYRMYFDDPAAFASVHAKYYLNKRTRVSKNKTASFNSGNFFGVKAKYASPTLCEKRTWHTLLGGFHWGLQRKMGKSFVCQLNIGIGAAIDLESKSSTSMTLFPDVNFRISYILPFNR